MPLLCKPKNTTTTWSELKGIDKNECVDGPHMCLTGLSHPPKIRMNIPAQSWWHRLKSPLCQQPGAMVCMMLMMGLWRQNASNRFGLDDSWTPWIWEVSRGGREAAYKRQLFVMINVFFIHRVSVFVFVCKYRGNTSHADRWRWGNCVPLPRLLSELLHTEPDRQVGGEKEKNYRSHRMPFKHHNVSR